jgi:hypothetical protein
MPETPFLDLFSGNKELFESVSREYDITAELLASKATTYGLPSRLEELDEEQQGILNDLSVWTAHHSIHSAMERSNSGHLA